ncbi:hypothetical protein NDU88_006865 [Pleurodeles waltl]|uniref:Uncharacterized protein n=1 Tax=Pleurodeles waltl TaxID=8319 RepID=A0AAV7RMS7_PLEWA|nr:hypothetical protein NDU88_006865 [Pleurodeles waltl]
MEKITLAKAESIISESCEGRWVWVLEAELEKRWGIIVAKVKVAQVNIPFVMKVMRSWEGLPPLHNAFTLTMQDFDERGDGCISEGKQLNLKVVRSRGPKQDATLLDYDEDDEALEEGEIVDHQMGDDTLDHEWQR